MPNALPDIPAIVAGVTNFLSALRKVFPDLSAEEILQKLEELEHSPLAQELLSLVLQLLKVKL